MQKIDYIKQIKNQRKNLKAKIKKQTRYWSHKKKYII